MSTNNNKENHYQTMEDINHSNDNKRHSTDDSVVKQQEGSKSSLDEEASKVPHGRGGRDGHGRGRGRGRDRHHGHGHGRGRGRTAYDRREHNNNNRKNGSSVSKNKEEEGTTTIPLLVSESEEEIKKPYNNHKSNSVANAITATDGSKSFVVDDKLPKEALENDPRLKEPKNSRNIKAKPGSKAKGRNTESFDPSSTLIRPALRVQIGSPTAKYYQRIMKHDDVIIVPELFGPEEDWSIYYKLVEEMTALQQAEQRGTEWISWHEGAHLVVKKPDASQTYQKVISKLCDYFRIDPSTAGTRFNFYKDCSDWKPFHHDSAAFNVERAQNQNITVGVSFGTTRELAFLRAHPESSQSTPDRIYFPQTNNGVFTFGRDVNIHWKHGINALSEEEISARQNKGRISIILWGKVTHNVVEEPHSPPMLGSDGKGPHASVNNHKFDQGRQRQRREHQQKNHRGTTTTSHGGRNEGQHSSST